MQNLVSIIKKYKSAVIGFSGGCDSTLLLYASLKAGIKVKAVTFHSIFYPNSELTLAKDTAGALGASHCVITFNPLDLPLMKSNPKNRCYICKKYLFGKLKEMADKEDYDAVFDGSNTDDLNDYRPGFQAVKEFGIISPLIEAGLTKVRIRELLRQAGLSQWNKQSFACYFSRFPYGTHINTELVKQVSTAEQALHNLGLLSARVRLHKDCARIETDENDFKRVATDYLIRDNAIKAVKNAGFIYVALDLEGYRTGSMNESLMIDKSSADKKSGD